MTDQHSPTATPQAPTVTDRASVVTGVGRVPLRIIGSRGPVVLAVHGAIVDGRLWNSVAAALQEEATILLPDLPLGSQLEPVPDRSRLTPPNLADALVELLDARGIESATLVGNDTGGALSQIAVSRHPDRFDALVLTSCDSLDHFPPPLLRPVPSLVRIPGFTKLLLKVFSSPRMVTRPGPLNILAAQPVDRVLAQSMLRPALENPDIRRDLSALFENMSAQHTQQAGEELGSWEKPIVLAWSRRDRLFPPADAKRLAALWPTSTLHWIDGALTFSPLDQPEAVAAAIRVALSSVDASR